MAEKITIEKGSVQETLLVPLYGRKLCAEQFPELYNDTSAAELLSHIDGWKQRKAAKEELLARLAPLFNLLSGGGTIEGLNAYVKQ